MTASTASSTERDCTLTTRFAYWITDAYINEDAGEDLSRDAGGTYGAILWYSSWGSAVRRAHSKLDYRSQILIERHMAVCMDCRCVLPMQYRPTWEDLAAMFEGSTVSGAERAYKNAVRMRSCRKKS